MRKIQPGWYFIFSVDEEDKEELVILKKPNKFDLSRLNDEIEQFVVENIIYPGVIDVLKLFDKHPTLASDILAELNRANLVQESESYDEISITEVSDPPPEPEQVAQEDYEIDFSL